MTAGTDGPPPREAPAASRWEALAARWRRRLDWWRWPEVLVASMLVAVWAGIPGIQLGLIGFVLMVGVALWIHLAAVESGSHALLGIVTVVLLLLAVLTLVASPFALLRPSPASFATASLSILAHNELVRLNFARRRGAEVEDEVFVGSGLGMGLVALVTVIGLVVAGGLGRSGERSWLWMPVAVLALVVVAGGLVLGPARGAPDPSRQRWRPGDRIPPQPLGRDDDLPG